MPPGADAPSAGLRALAALAPLVATGLAWAVGLPTELCAPMLWISIGLAPLVWWRGERLPALLGVSTALVALVVSVSLGDLALRVVIRDASSLLPAMERYPPNPDLVRMPRNQVFDRSGYGDIAAMAGIEQGEPRHVFVRSDRLGFRNPPTFPDRPVDVINLGDSFGAGTGASDEELWDWYFEAQGYDTYNLSTVATPWAELMNLKSELDHVPTDSQTVVLWQLFTGNDLDYKYEDYLDFEPNGPIAQWWVRFRSFRRRSPIYQYVESWRDGPDRTALHGSHDPSFLYLPGYTAAAKRRVRDVEAHFNYPIMVRVFQEMGRYAASNHCRVVVVLVPTKWEVYAWLEDPEHVELAEAPSGFSKVVERLCRAEDFPFLDLKPVLLRAAHRVWERDGAYLWWKDDTHLNPGGYRVTAEAILRELLDPLLGGGEQRHASGSSAPRP